MKRINVEHLKDKLEKLKALQCVEQSRLSGRVTETKKMGQCDIFMLYVCINNIIWGPM